MIYKDRIYGEFEITEPVILDLINCPTLQRLKDIDQGGYDEPFFPGSAHSRFEHSVGVYLLLKIYNASLDEQIAGLIHDVSHSAFSHTIDYVLEGVSETESGHQDSIHDKFVKNSGIPRILSAYGIDVGYILDDSNFPLKETLLPDLCADRIDYSLREAVLFGLSSAAEVNDILSHLKAENGLWIFDSYDVARNYAEIFYDLNLNYYAGLPTVVMFRTLADYLRRAIRQGYITEADLYTTDLIVLAKIAPFHQTDSELIRLFERLNNKVAFHDDPEGRGVAVACKSRVVDPLCHVGDEIKRVSDVDPKWEEVVKSESQPKRYSIVFDR